MDSDIIPQTALNFPCQHGASDALLKNEVGEKIQYSLRKQEGRTWAEKLGIKSCPTQPIPDNLTQTRRIWMITNIPFVYRLQHTHKQHYK